MSTAATGILSTPVIDRARGRLYVTACDERQRWQAYALDIASGNVLPGWPLRLQAGFWRMAAPRLRHRLTLALVHPLQTA